MYEIIEHDGRVEIEGAGVEQVRAAMRLLDSVQELQWKHLLLTKAELVHVMTRSDLPLTPPASLEQARRLSQLRTDMLTTPAFSYDTLAELRRDARISTTRTAVARWRKQRKVFTVPDGKRTLLPAFQFSDAGEPRADLAAPLKVLLSAGVDGWDLWTWLTKPTPLLSGDIPCEVAAFNPERALKAARAFADRW